MVNQQQENEGVQNKYTQHCINLQKKKEEIFDEIEKTEARATYLVGLLKALNTIDNSYVLKRNRDGTIKNFESKNVILQSSETVQTEQVNVGFEDVNTGSEVAIPTLPMYYTPTTSTNADLQDYLARPVLIDTINWAIGGSVIANATPWHAYLNHAAIKRKVDNYAFIRGDLHIKIMINASPFYYGAVLCSYLPLFGYIAPSPIAATNDLVPKSQRPHVYVYPQTNEGAEMVLPFLHYSEWLRLSSASQVSNFGRLHFDSMDDLRNANGLTAQSVDINVYAWLENVELAGLTMEVALQSDEYAPSKGPISKPATAIARAMGLLDKLPIIGPFATATRIAADSTANIASLFGYSKVPVISDVQPFKDLPFHGLASSDISGPTDPLSLDSKNELTVTNKCLGDSDDDPLNITKFVGRKSYLTQFAWAATDVTTTRLWNTYVTPNYVAITAATNQTEIQSTPISLVSNMFKFWRGDIIFEFKILCSQYHRGRLRFTWDPVGEIGTTTDTLTEAYNQIVDIQETTNVSMRIPYMQDFAYQQTVTDITSTVYGTSGLAADFSGVTNGILTVRVLNEQTSPVASAPITILVSVYGADNLEFCAPKEIDPLLTYVTTQSLERNIDDLVNKDMGSPSTVDKNINLVYMGEKVTTMRSLTARANHSMSFQTKTHLTLNQTITSIINRRPIFPGFDLEGIGYATGLTSGLSAKYNFVSNTPYHLLRPCFLGERGGIVWKVNIASEWDRSIIVDRLSRTTLGTAYAPVVTTIANTNPSIASSTYVNLYDSNSGMALTNQKTQTGVSVTAPMYTRAAWLETNPTYATQGVSGTGSATDSLQIKFIQIFSASEEYEPISYFFQTAVDHSFYFFLNCPTMYLYASAPVPAAAP